MLMLRGRAYRNARVHGTALGRRPVKGKTVSPLPNVAGEIFPEVIDGNHDSEKTEKSDYKKNFASCNLRLSSISLGRHNQALHHVAALVLGKLPVARKHVAFCVLGA